MGDSALAVRIEEGKNFPKDAFSTFRVAALFDDEPRSTVRRRRAARASLAGCS